MKIIITERQSKDIKKISSKGCLITSYASLLANAGIKSHLDQS